MTRRGKRNYRSAREFDNGVTRSAGGTTGRIFMAIDNEEDTGITGMEYRSREFDNGVSMGTSVRVGKIMPMDVWSDGGILE